MHFTRMGGYGDRPTSPIIVRGRRVLPRGRERQALPRRARRALLGQHRLRLTARRSGRRRSSRCASCRSTRTGRTRIRARSSSRPRSRRSRPATSTARSSSPAARRRSSRRGSSRASTTSRAARSGCAPCAGATPERDHDAIAANLPTPPAPLQGDHPPDRVPRDDDRRALAHRDPRDPRCRSSRSLPEVRNVRNTNRYRRPDGETEEEFTADLLAELEQTIESMGPETVCLVHMEPVQNSGGAFTPPVGYWQGVREICDRYDILLSADEVITGLRPDRALVRLGALRHPARTSSRRAKGLSSSYAAIGAVIATDRVMEPFLDATSMYSHGITFGGHPVMCAIALQEHRDHEARAGSSSTCARREDVFRAKLETLLDLADRRRRPRRRLLLRARARQGLGDEADVRRRRVRGAAARLPLAGASSTRA